MRDTINRQVALEKLPPAEPEIIRCRVCMYRADYYNGEWYCSNPKPGFMYFGNDLDFYCALGKKGEPQ